MSTTQTRPSDRQERREATTRRILDAAWALSRERGLTGWTLRDLAAAVGMRAPSLYGYVDSKNALYDALFADGYARLIERETEPDGDVGSPRERVRLAAHRYVDFSVEDAARFHLLFLRTVPGFEPSPESYALAQRSLAAFTDLLASAGVEDPADVDLWTAVLTGLASQQVSNDPGGSRWSKLVDEAVERLLPGPV